MYEVAGTVRLAGWRGEIGPAMVRVRLLDTSRVDLAARLVAEVHVAVARLEELAQADLPFALVAGPIDPRARYEIAVWIDVDGDGAVSVGDYVSTRAYPVLTRGSTDRVAVAVQPVGRGAQQENPKR